MRISTILDHIDSGHMALPEFHRESKWDERTLTNCYLINWELRDSCTAPREMSKTQPDRFRLSEENHA